MFPSKEAIKFLYTMALDILQTQWSPLNIFCGCESCGLCELNYCNRSLHAKFIMSVYKNYSFRLVAQGYIALQLTNFVLGLS